LDESIKKKIEQVSHVVDETRKVDQERQGGVEGGGYQEAINVSYSL
jgi:hypothetical protein